MQKSFFLIIILFILYGSSTAIAEQLYNSTQIVVTDNRIKSKNIVFNFSVDDIEYKCQISHKRWHQLQISPPFVLREDGLTASLTGAFFVNEKLYKNEYTLPSLFWEKLQEKTSISTSEKYMTNIIVNKSQEMFLVYFQEILNLDVSIPETQQEYTFELPSHRSVTVVMNLMSMK